MNFAVCLLALLPCIFASPVVVDQNALRHLQADIDKNITSMEHAFREFKRIHKKEYANEFDEAMRKQIFKNNVAYIAYHNTELYAHGKKSYYLGVNEFTDLSHDEFLKLYTSPFKKSTDNEASAYLSPANVLVPENVDWRTKNYVTPVKNQGQCGSCWSFSATGSLEGQNYKKKGKLVSLSEQQLIDCSGSFGNEGCNGGLMDQAFKYIKSAGGIDSEDDYKYLAEKEDQCYYKKDLEVAEVTGFVDLPEGDESKLKEAVGTIGPVSIAIDASHSSFQMYRGGIYDEPECSSTQLDHGVLVVGYGVEDSQDYWLVKNSWGTSWGDEGYVKMTRNKDNQCGVATQASYPLV